MKTNKNSFEQQIIDEINNLRQNPSSIVKRCEVFRTGISRLKLPKEYLNEIDGVILSFKTMKKAEPMIKNTDLAQAAVGQMSKFLNETETYVKIQEGEMMKRIVPEKFYDEKPVLFADAGGDAPIDCVVKLLLSREDKDRIAKKRLSDPAYTQIGVAHSVKNDDNHIVIVIAEKAGKEKVPLPEGDLTELKQAFDLFDIYNIGKIDINETIGAMRKLNMDMRNPELFQIMKELDQVNSPWVDFPTFATHILGKITDKKSTEGLRTIFNLFRDNSDRDEISIVNLLKIVTELGEIDAQSELKQLLSNKGGSKAMITFDEFEEFMQKTYSAD